MRRMLCLLALFAAFIPTIFGQAVATFRNGDIFEMRLSGMPMEDAQPFAQQFTVGPDGTVNVPLIGEIKAVGLTAPQLERTLQNRLIAGKIFTQPTVTINQVQGVRMVSVIGGVKSPGRLPWTVDLTLTTAIGLCGGLDIGGSVKGVRIVREGKVIGVYNLKDIDKDTSKDQKLLPGDQVIVRE